MKLGETIRAVQDRRRTFHIGAIEAIHPAAKRIAAALPKTPDRQETVAAIYGYTTALLANPEIYGYMVHTNYIKGSPRYDDVTLTVLAERKNSVEGSKELQERVSRLIYSADMASKVLSPIRQSFFIHKEYRFVTSDDRPGQIAEELRLRYSTGINSTKTAGIVLFHREGEEVQGAEHSQDVPTQAQSDVVASLYSRKDWPTEEEVERVAAEGQRRLDAQLEVNARNRRWPPDADSVILRTD